MEILSEQQQIDILRDKCDNACKRIWIASPYIGSLKDIQRIIGGKWLLPSIDCRILTDIDSGFVRQDTFDEFLNDKVEVRSLDSLHSKIYIVDDWCLVTSANLTGTAFLCRYEMGVALNNEKEVENTYLRWWNIAKKVSYIATKPLKEILDYQDGHMFKKKFKAKPYNSAQQDKYEAMCEKYIEFAKIYENVTGRNSKMVADGYTLLQEVDYLFNYLYHDHPHRPSHGQNTVRNLTNVQREKAIKKYFNDMCSYYNDEPQYWRLERTQTIQSILAHNNIGSIQWDDAKKVVYCLHCLSSYPINRTKFLNPKNNNLNDIKDCWYHLLHTGKIDISKIKYVTNKLKNFGLSSIYELIGWYYPDKYPLMNNNSHCGMRFFGYTM